MLASPCCHSHCDPCDGLDWNLDAQFNNVVEFIPGTEYALFSCASNLPVHYYMASLGNTEGFVLDSLLVDLGDPVCGASINWGNIDSEAYAFPYEVCWTLECDNGLSADNGCVVNGGTGNGEADSPYGHYVGTPGGVFETVVLPPDGTECSLSMLDTYGDSWNGNLWTGFGYEFTGPSAEDGSNWITATFAIDSSMVECEYIDPPRPGDEPLGGWEGPLLNARLDCQAWKDYYATTVGIAPPHLCCGDVIYNEGGTRVFTPVPTAAPTPPPTPPTPSPTTTTPPPTPVQASTPAPTMAEMEDVGTYVTSALTFDGLTVEDAMAMEDEITEAIATTLGVDSDNVLITSYGDPDRRLKDRRLQGDTVQVEFAVKIDEGMDEAAIVGSVDAMASAEGGSALLTEIKTLVEQDPEKAELLAKLADVTVTAEAPVIEVRTTTSTEAPGPDSGAAMAAIVGAAAAAVMLGPA